MSDDPLLTLIAGMLGVPRGDVTEASGMSNPRRWDSLRQINVMMELEVQYGLRLSDDDILQATTVAKIRECLARHGVDVV